jgi:uncharacterized membrane protein (Fun14 family)
MIVSWAWPAATVWAQQHAPAGPFEPGREEPPPGPFGPVPSDASAPALPSDGGGLWSSGLFLRLGFSFIVGLAVGFALKIALKIALVVGGALLVILFALQYAGLIDINWSGMESNYDGIVEWLSAYAAGLKDFMAENLSSTASFSAGLLVGLRL